MTKPTENYTDLPEGVMNKSRMTHSYNMLLLIARDAIETPFNICNWQSPRGDVGRTTMPKTHNELIKNNKAHKKNLIDLSMGFARDDVHTCKTAACYGGYLALSETFQRMGGSVGAGGWPQYQGEMSFTAIALWLGISDKQAYSIADTGMLYSDTPYSEKANEDGAMGVRTIQSQSVTPNMVAAAIRYLRDMETLEGFYLHEKLIKDLPADAWVA